MATIYCKHSHGSFIGSIYPQQLSTLFFFFLAHLLIITIMCNQGPCVTAQMWHSLGDALVSLRHQWAYYCEQYWWERNIKIAFNWHDDAWVSLTELEQRWGIFLHSPGQLFSGSPDYTWLYTVHAPVPVPYCAIGPRRHTLTLTVITLILDALICNWHHRLSKVSTQSKVCPT